MKKGQIALYAIIAVLLVSAVGTVIYLQREQIGLQLAPQISDEARPVNTFIESCIEKTGEDALFFIGLQGGYYIPSENAAGSIAYYFYENKSFFPEKKAIEKELAFYVNDNLLGCIKNFSDFSDYTITYRDVNTTALILNNKVKFKVDWLVTIKRTAIYNLDFFSIEIPSRLSTIYAVAMNIISEHLKSHRICISCIIDWAYENDLYVDMENIGGNSILFTIRDSKVMLNNQPYEFTFANKY